MTRAARTLQPVLILGSFALAGCVAFGWPAGTVFPAGPRWLALALLGLLATLTWRRGAPGVTVIEVWAGVLLGWCALSLAWSPDPGAGFFSILRAGALVAVGIGVARASEKLVALIPTFAGISAIIAVCLALVWPVSSGGFGNENFITAFLLLAVPLSWLGWRPGAIGTTALAAAYLLFINGSRLEFPVVGGAAAVLVIPYAWRLTRWGTVGLMAGAAALAVLLALALADSVGVRLEIWSAVVTLVGQAPWFGHGFGGFDYLLSTVHGDTGQIFQSPFTWVNTAHNDFLELASVTGLVGVGLAVGLGVALLRAPVLPAVRWTIYSGLVLAFGDFPFQQPAPALMLAVAAGLAARSAVRLPIPELGLGLVTRSALVGLTLFATPYLADAWRAQALFSKAYAISSLHPPLAFRTGMEAARIHSFDPFIRRHLMLYLANAASWCADNPKCEAIIPALAADAVFALAVSAGPSFPGLQIARAQYMLNSGRWAEPEMLTLTQYLQTRFPHYPETWILTAWTAERRHDAVGLLVSFKHLADLGLSPNHKLEIRRLMATVTFQPNPLLGKL